MIGIKSLFVLAVGLAVAGAGTATARQDAPYRVSDRQLRELVNRIDTHRGAFHASFSQALDRSRVKGNLADGEIDRSESAFEQAADLLRDRLNDARADRSDAASLLRCASSIDRFMTRNQLDKPAQSDWETLRLDMDDLARAYGMAWRPSAASQNVADRVDDRHVDLLLKQIREKADRFDRSLEGAFDRGRIDEVEGKDAIHLAVRDFKQAADRLRDRLKGRQADIADVEEVLRRGAVIDGIMQRHQLTARAEQNWLSLRGDLDRLARASNIAWTSSDPEYTLTVQDAGLHRRLTGTHQTELTITTGDPGAQRPIPGAQC